MEPTFIWTGSTYSWSILSTIPVAVKVWKPCMVAVTVYDPIGS